MGTVNVIGHKAQLEALTRLRVQGRIPPLLLFVGPNGVGKRQVARALAQQMVCELGSACGQCGPCKRIERSESESLLEVRPEGASLKVEQAREVLGYIQLAHPGKARIVIVDEAEKMTPQVGNALLKSFEEPPEKTHFIVLAPNPSAVLSTIRSRAQVIRFGVLTEAELKTLRPEAPNWVLRSASGRVARVDQLMDPEKLDLRAKAFDLLQKARGASRGQLVEVLKELSLNRETALDMTLYWRDFLRDALMCRMDTSAVLHVDMQDSIEQTLPFDEATLLQLSENVQKLENHLRTNMDIQLNLENFLAETGHLTLAGPSGL